MLLRIVLVFNENYYHLSSISAPARVRHCTHATIDRSHRIPTGNADSPATGAMRGTDFDNRHQAIIEGEKAGLAAIAAIKLKVTEKTVAVTN